MYKSLIVDDENIIRIGIQTVIPWKELDVDEVFSASNGFDALKIIESEKPDILITDINMSEMTGLELIEKAKKLHPEMRIIVMTGYDYFEYAHRCIKMRVNDFFLKPVNEDELQKSIQKQISCIVEERQKKITRRSEGTTEQYSLEAHMRDLISRSISDDDILTICQDYGINQNQNIHAAVLVPALHEDSDEFRILSMKYTCIDLFDKQQAGITFQDESGRIVIAVFQSSEMDDVVERISQLAMLLQDDFGIVFKESIGKEVTGLESLHISYTDAVSLLEQEENIISEALRSYLPKNRLSAFYKTFADIRDALAENTDNVDAVLNLLASFEHAVEVHNLSTPLLRKSCFELAAAVSYAYMLESGNFPEQSLQALAESLIGAHRESALEFTKSAIFKIVSLPDENIHNIITKVKSIINENLSENISVLSIASSLYISPNYLSRLFKKKTGEGCNAYIIRKRIEKAKYLLNTTDIPSGKIASMVGYQDINYFSIAFKKHVGASPTAYRELK